MILRVAPVLLLFAGCVIFPIADDFGIPRTTRDAYVDAQPELDPRIAKAIRSGDVVPGMTEEQLRAALPPDPPLRTEIEGRRRVLRLRGSSTDMYWSCVLEDGVVVSAQLHRQGEEDVPLPKRLRVEVPPFP
ncbi:MAG: hypothetical protein ACE5JG_07980 [Planctomycetota bacterium]